MLAFLMLFPVAACKSFSDATSHDGSPRTELEAINLGTVFGDTVVQEMSLLLTQCGHRF